MRRAGKGAVRLTGREAAALDRLDQRWDRFGVSGSGSDEDAPVPRRGAVRPPPSLAPDDVPDSVHVPRMEPPPPSLEAMVQSNGRSGGPEHNQSWWLWLALVVAAVIVTGLVMR